MTRLLRSFGAGTAITAWFAVPLLAPPILIALGLWLLGVPLDWLSWKTYAGLVALTAAMALAG